MFNLVKNLLTITIAVVLASFVGLKLYINSLPPIRNLEYFTPNIVTKIYSADGQIIKTFTAFKFEEVDIDKVPQYLKDAIIATEDKNFYSHEGYDLFGLFRSIFANLKAGSLVQGASTITQQLARILFLSNEKTFDRKIKEFIVSAQIEKTLSKDQILEMYLNNVYLGSGAYGVAGAAQIYFNKSLRELTLSECALIAGLPQAPSVYSPFNNFKLAQKRKKHVLQRMYKMRFITRQEYEKALAAKIHLNDNPSIYSFNKAPYFVDYVMNELEGLGFDETQISQGGYKIITTLDYAAQKAADESIKKNLKAWGLTHDKQQAAAYAIHPSSGEIVVFIGGKNYAKSQYDRITQAIRPPGSAFKPFVYASALQNGWKIEDKLFDTPVKIADWSPKNYGNKYRGELPLYAGLTYSSNVMAARLIKEVGIRPVINLCKSLGITTPLEYDYTIALGSNGVKLSEMVVAYGAFANGGYKVKPFSVLRVETSRGKVIYEAPKTKISKAMTIEAASGITAMLKTVLQNGTGKAANIGKPAAGKTGTTDNYKDAWFLGYTPDIVCGIWVGNDDNTVMTQNLTGGTIPALIWKDTMKVATTKYGNVDFTYESIDLSKKTFGTIKYIVPNQVKQIGVEQKNKQQSVSSNVTNRTEQVLKEASNIKSSVTNIIKKVNPVQQQNSSIPSTNAVAPKVKPSEVKAPSVKKIMQPSSTTQSAPIAAPVNPQPVPPNDAYIPKPINSQEIEDLSD